MMGLLSEQLRCFSFGYGRVAGFLISPSPSVDLTNRIGGKRFSANRCGPSDVVDPAHMEDR